MPHLQTMFSINRASGTAVPCLVVPQCRTYTRTQPCHVYVLETVDGGEGLCTDFIYADVRCIRMTSIIAFL